MTQEEQEQEIGKAEPEWLRRHIDAKAWNGVDVGCGSRKAIPGAIGLDLARDEFTDPSSGAVTAAEWVGLGYPLPFRDGVLDYVVSKHSLEHMPDWREALRDWARCLRPAGILSVVVPEPSSPHHPGHGLPFWEVAQYLAGLGGVVIDHNACLAPWGDGGVAYSWGITWCKV